MDKLLKRLALTIFDAKEPNRKDDGGDDGPWIDDHKTYGAPGRVLTKRDLSSDS